MSLSVLFDGSDEMFDIGTPPPQRNYIKFTRPLTNRARHWDVETEDWFFEDAAEQSGWAGYESGQLTWKATSAADIAFQVSCPGSPGETFVGGIACLQHAVFSCPCNVSMAVCVLKSASSLPGSGCGDADAVKRLHGKPFRGTCSSSAMCHASSQTCAADWVRKVQLHVAVCAI